MFPATFLIDCLRFFMDHNQARRPVDLMPHRTAISPRLLPRINPGSEEDEK